MKQNVFHYPEKDSIYLGRALATAHDGDILWTAVQVEEQKRNQIAVMRHAGDDPSMLTLRSAGYC